MASAKNDQPLLSNGEVRGRRCQFEEVLCFRVGDEECFEVGAVVGGCEGGLGLRVGALGDVVSVQLYFEVFR